MCRLERNTARRGRSAVPTTRRLTRACRFSRPCRLARAASMVATPYLSTLLGGLPGLAAHLLARVAHALALVWVGTAQAADLGGHLADPLLVDALHREPGGRVHLEADALRGLDHDRVRVAEAEHQVGALGLHPVADALDLEPLLEAVGHALDHVGHQRADQAVARPAVALVVGPHHAQHAVGLLEGDRRRDLLGEGALRAGHHRRRALHLHLDARGDLDGEVADTGHARSPLPDVGQDLAADAGLVGVAVGDEPLGGRDDGDAEPAEDPRQRLLLGVHAQPRLGDAAHAADRPLAVGAVLQLDLEAAADLGPLHRPVLDVALLLEDLGELHLDLGAGHDDVVVVGGVAVAQPREHVGDRVGHGHPRSPPYQLDLVTPGSSPAWASCRTQMRQRPNLRSTARGRPQRWQRV